MQDHPEIIINRKWCKGCGICITLCPKAVYEKDEFGKPVVAHVEKCSVCRICEYRCPDFAIKIGGQKK
jgi:2-oxoglutarate ferredoxin oxidoreductase subunit delta